MIARRYGGDDQEAGDGNMATRLHTLNLALTISILLLRSFHSFMLDRLKTSSARNTVIVCYQHSSGRLLSSRQASNSMDGNRACDPHLLMKWLADVDSVLLPLFPFPVGRNSPFRSVPRLTLANRIGSIVVKTLRLLGLPMSV